LFGWPGKFLAYSDRTLLDTTLTGAFELGGRTHDLVFGLNAADADHGYLEYEAPADAPAWGELPAFPGWTGREAGRPLFGAPTLAAEWTDDIRRVYGVARFDVTDALDVIAGFNAIDVQSAGFNFDELRDRDEQETSPYVGVTYALNDKAHFYASYSDIY